MATRLAAVVVQSWLLAWAAGAEGQVCLALSLARALSVSLTHTLPVSQPGFIFDTSGERPLTMPFRLHVGLLGFESDQLRSGAELSAVEIESALMVRRCDTVRARHSASSIARQR